MFRKQNVTDVMTSSIAPVCLPFFHHFNTKKSIHSTLVPNQINNTYQKDRQHFHGLLLLTGILPRKSKS